MAMADGYRAETEAAMVDGNRKGNKQQQRQWAMVTGTATELAPVTEMATAVAMAMATAKATMTKGGLPLHVLAMCSAVTGATPCLHPHGHKGVCIHQRCVMGMNLCSLSRGRVPDSSPWIVFLFIFYKYCSDY